METSEILYKYVPHAIALKCIPEIGDGTLRATQPAALNDPFEFAVVPGNRQAEDTRELAKIITSINERSPVTEGDVDDAEQRHGSLFLRHLLAQQLSTKFGIVAFATDPLHPLMWSHYAAYGSGFVIGYKGSRLNNLANPDENLKRVQYCERLLPLSVPKVLISPRSNLSILLSMKSHHWSYENEWRLIVGLDKTIGTGDIDQRSQPINLLSIPNEAIVSVYYTERTPEQSINLIRDRLSDPNNRYRAGNPIKLVMSPTSYGYVEAQD